VINAIVHILQQDASIELLVDDSIDMFFREQGVALPSILVEKDTSEPIDSKGTSSLMDRNRVVVTAFSESYGTAHRVMLLSREALDGYVGNVFSGDDQVAIDHIRFVSDSDDYYDLPEGIIQITHIYNVDVKRTGSVVQANCSPVSIVNQDNVEIDSVAAGGTYEVIELSGIQDDGSATYTNSIIDNG